MIATNGSNRDDNLYYKSILRSLERMDQTDPMERVDLLITEIQTQQYTW